MLIRLWGPRVPVLGIFADSLWLSVSGLYRFTLSVGPWVVVELARTSRVVSSVAGRGVVFCFSGSSLGVDVEFRGESVNEFLVSYVWEIGTVVSRVHEFAEELGSLVEFLGCVDPFLGDGGAYPLIGVPGG